MRLLLASVAAVAVAAAALLGVTAVARSGSPEPDTRLVVQIEIHDANPDITFTSYTLECGPTGGTMPHAEELCRLIALHPIMLDPPRVLAMCDGFNIPYVRLHGVSDGIKVDVIGMEGCSWPGGDVAMAYYAAAMAIDQLEPAARRLHCHEDPALTGEYVPYEDVLACLNAPW